MIVDRCQMKTKQNVAGLAQFVCHTLPNIALHLELQRVKVMIIDFFLFWLDSR